MSYQRTPLTGTFGKPSGRITPCKRVEAQLVAEIQGLNNPKLPKSLTLGGLPKEGPVPAPQHSDYARQPNKAQVFYTFILSRRDHSLLAIVKQYLQRVVAEKRSL